MIVVDVLFHNTSKRQYWQFGIVCFVSGLNVSSHNREIIVLTKFRSFAHVSIKECVQIVLGLATFCGPFHYHGLTLIPAGISNYIKMCGVKLLIHSQTSTVQPLEFGVDK